MADVHHVGRSEKPASRQSAGGHSGDTVSLSLGHQELIIRQRWEVVSVSNDIVIALWFIAGSVLFFSESTTTIGTWFFLFGSIELFIRPAIRLARRIHLQRLQPARARYDDSNDY